MSPSAVLETVLYADDLVAAEAFYSGVLGLERYAFKPDRQIFYRLGQQMLLIFLPQATRIPAPDESDFPVPAHGTTGAGHVCFSASEAEIEAWQEKFVTNGIPIDADFSWPGGGRSLYIRDPAGNSIEFAEPRIWGFVT